MLVGCAGSDRMRNVGNEAIGVGERTRVRLGGLHLEVPGENLAYVRLVLQRGDERLELELANAPALSTEALADGERRRMSGAFDDAPGEGESRVEEDAVFVQGIRMRRLRTPAQTVLVGMRNPWRRLRIAAGPALSLGDLEGAVGARWRIAGLAMTLPGFVLSEAELRSPTGRIRVGADGCAGIEATAPLAFECRSD